MCIDWLAYELSISGGRTGKVDGNCTCSAGGQAPEQAICKATAIRLDIETVKNCDSNVGKEESRHWKL